MKIIVVPRGISSGILESQVVTPWSLSNSVRFLPIGGDERLDARALNVIGFKDLFGLRRSVKVVYCRDFYSFFRFFILRAFFSFNLIYDFRGIAHQESYMRNGSKIRRWLIRRIEGLCFRYADEVRVVSKNMRDYLFYCYNFKRDVLVIPCCILSSKISSYESRVESQSVFRFVYVGGLSRWQCFDDVVRMYSELTVPKLFSVFTPSPIEAKAILKKYNVDASVRTAPREEVLNSLLGYDFGFVLREDDPVNTVASPVKFLEYCSQGVVPITTRYCGDYASEFSDIAYVLNDIDCSIDMDALLKLGSEDNRRKIIERCKKYSWDNYAPKFDAEFFNN